MCHEYGVLVGINWSESVLCYCIHTVSMVYLYLVGKSVWSRYMAYITVWCSQWAVIGISTHCSRYDWWAFIGVLLSQREGEGTEESG